jgi:hypothetical protein
MAAYLNQFGFIPWFSNSVVDVVSGMGLSWQPAFGVIILLYFYSHYFFASGGRACGGALGGALQRFQSRGAGADEGADGAPAGASPGLLSFWVCDLRLTPPRAPPPPTHPPTQARPTSARCTPRSSRSRAPAARPACSRRSRSARCPTSWAASRRTASAARRPTSAPATCRRCGALCQGGLGRKPAHGARKRPFSTNVLAVARTLLAYSNLPHPPHPHTHPQKPGRVAQVWVPPVGVLPHRVGRLRAHLVEGDRRLVNRSPAVSPEAPRVHARAARRARAAAPHTAPARGPRRCARSARAARGVSQGARAPAVDGAPASWAGAEARRAAAIAIGSPPCTPLRLSALQCHPKIPPPPPAPRTDPTARHRVSGRFLPAREV